MTFLSFLDTRERRYTTDYILIPNANSSCQVLAHKQKLSAILSSFCVHLSFLICVLFFSHHLVACSFFNHFTLASLTNLTLFSPTFRLFIQHISKFCYFFLILSLKAVTSSVSEAKILILTSLSAAPCSPIKLKIYSVVKPHKHPFQKNCHIKFLFSIWGDYILYIKLLADNFWCNWSSVPSDSSWASLSDCPIVSPSTHFASPHHFQCQIQFVCSCCHACEIKTFYLTTH